MKIKKYNHKFEVIFESEPEKLAKKYFSIYYRDDYSPTGFSSKYIARKGCLPLGYLDTFVAKCAKLNFSIEIENLQLTPQCNQKFKLEDDRTLKDFQKKALEAIDYHTSGVISAPTGSGKTLLIEHTVAMKRGTTLIIVHSTDIRDELTESLGELLGEKNVTNKRPERPDWILKKLAATPFEIKNTKEMSAYKKAIYRHKKRESERLLEKTWHQPITVICWHSLKTLPQWYLDEVEVVLIDECDLSAIDEVRDAIMRMPKAFYKYGFSATPWRDQPHMDLLMRATLGNEVIFEYSPEDAISDNNICKPSLIVIRSEAPSKFIKYMKDWREIIEVGFITNDALNYQIAKKAADLVADNCKVFIAVDEIKHSMAITEQLKKFNITPVELNGSLTASEFKKAKEQIKNETSGYVMIGTQKVGRGTDIPNLDKMILAVNGKTSNKFIQKFGRVLRTLNSKKGEVEIFMFFNWWNNVTMKHSQEVQRIFERYYKIKPLY